MFYKAKHESTGRMWEVWVFLHEATYYLYYLARKTGEKWGNVSLATSTDGVHWNEWGPVVAKHSLSKGMGTGSTWKSPDFDTDHKFIMNFSESDGVRQNIFFAVSNDLWNWSRLGDEYRFVEDERWYRKTGRWDCIWSTARPEGGLYGYWTASPIRGVGFGFAVSEDGLHWETQPSPVLDWRQHDPAGDVEVGAIEKIGGSYFALLTAIDRNSPEHGLQNACFVARAPDGPFVAAEKNSNYRPRPLLVSEVLSTSGRHACLLLRQIKNW